jgi:hypothetical protein
VSELAAHSAHPPGFAHQFETVSQQRDAATLGIRFIARCIFKPLSPAAICWRSNSEPRIRRC